MGDEAMKGPLLTRREFGKALTGLVVAFTLVPELALTAEAGLPGNLGAVPMLDAWLRIDPDGRVTIFTGKVELGQGILTALAQIAAEELELRPAKVNMVSGDTSLTPDEGYTSGSQSIEHSGTAIRFACAEARKLLLDRASVRFGVPSRLLKVADGAVIAPNGRKLTYGNIAKAGLFHRRVTATVPPKPAARQGIVGRTCQRIDIPPKVTGDAVYVQDMRLAGMVFGRIARPPAPGAGLMSVDADAVRGMPGVLAVVRDGSFLGVIAQREEQAVNALAALQKSARWRLAADLPESDKIHDWLRAQPNAAEEVHKKSTGTPPEVKLRLEATFTKDYLAHASIGPSCAVALMQEEKLRIWSHTQGVYPLRRDLAKALNLDVQSIRVSHREGAGCYGHNGADDAALDAALLARALPGRPVMVQWMRDDEFAWEPFSPAMVMELSAGLAADGSIVDWRHEVWSNSHSNRPGRAEGVNLLAAWYLEKPFPPAAPRSIPQPTGGVDRNAVPIYDFPNLKVIKHLVKEMPLRTSALRTLGGDGNVFALESFMDELAAAVGADPVEFRLRHMKDPRARAVIETASEKAKWRPGSKSDGINGRGFGFAKYKNTSCYVACVADVSVDRRTGKVSVTRVVAAVDAGQIINPKGLEMQIEGGIIQSTSWTIMEAVGFDRQRVTSRDWKSYPILTFPDVPEVEIHLIDRPDEKPLGAGEASPGPASAAIVNGVSSILGRRVRKMPLDPEWIKSVPEESA
jgi:nicotinate dehydrogenase subunit B